MKRLLKQIAIVVFLGTMMVLLALHTHLMKTNNLRNEKISVLKRSVLYYQNVELMVQMSEQDDDEAADSNPYSDLLIPEQNPGREVFVEDRTRKFTNPSKESRITEKQQNVVEDVQNPDSSEKIVSKIMGPSTTSVASENIASSSTSETKTDITNLSMCPEYPDELVGPLDVNATYEPTEKEAIAAAGQISDGCYKPKWCQPRQNVAIIIPYKDRLRHLITLMHHLHPILQRQAIQYCIIVAEQYDNGAFNKARVMNAAFMEITNKFTNKFDCVIFHDVDMILEDDRNLHACTRMPRHLSPAIDKFNYTLNYGTKYGGVTAMSVEKYKEVNGHSNNFWGWGGEDNDMEMRIAYHNLTINVTNTTYGRYKMIPHDHPWWFSPLYGVGSYLKSRKHWTARNVDKSGLSDVRYGLRFTSYHKLWTKLTLDIRTFLVEKATVRFRGYDNLGYLELASPSFKTEKERSTEPSRYTKEPEKCVYYKFTNKTVNKTLGLLERSRLTYGRMYDTLERAKEICDEMQTYCGSIVEEHPGKYSLRASGYMHENKLRYRAGVMKQEEIVEIHHTKSVHVKTCPESVSHLSFFKNPIILAGDAEQGPSPAYSIEFRIRLFYNIKKTLYYTSEVMTTHRATAIDLVDTVKVEESPLWTTLSNSYNSKLKLLNTSDPKSIQAATGKRTTLAKILQENEGILTVKTPLSGILRRPGCYICRSSLDDEDGVSLLQWRWWFEVRARTQEIEDAILEGILKKSEHQNSEFVDTIEKRREMWLKYQEMLKKSGNKNNRGVPDRVLDIVRKHSFNSEDHQP